MGSRCEQHFFDAGAAQEHCKRNQLTTTGARASQLTTRGARQEHPTIVPPTSAKGRSQTRTATTIVRRADRSTVPAVADTAAAVALTAAGAGAAGAVVAHGRWHGLQQ